MPRPRIRNNKGLSRNTVTRTSVRLRVRVRVRAREREREKKRKKPLNNPWMRPRIRIRASRVRSTGGQSAADNDPLSACDKDTAANWRDPPWLEYTPWYETFLLFFLSLFSLLPRRERRWLIAVRLLSTSMHTGPCDGRMRGPGESRAPTSSPPFPPLSLFYRKTDATLRSLLSCQSIQSSPVYV